MKVSNLALAAGLLIASAALAPDSAEAQYGSASQRAEEEARDGQPQSRSERRRRGRQQQQQAEQPAGPQISDAERAAILPLQEAITAQDWAAATAALPAAQAAASSPDAKFLVGNFQFRIGQGTSSEQVQSQGVDAMLASGAVPAENLKVLLGAQASFAINAQNWPVAEQSLVRYLEQDPGNAERIRQLAEVKIRMNKYGEALPLYRQMIETAESAGQPASEDQYRRAYALAIEARQPDAAKALGEKMLRTYPTAQNWRTSLFALGQQVGDGDAALAIDVRRMMRAVPAMAQSADYLDLADRLNRAGLPGEAAAVIQDGLTRGHIPSSDSTARSMLSAATERAAEDRRTMASARTRALAASTGRDARNVGDLYYGAGQYAEAAELYQAALQKGGEDSNLLNSRLGASLALAGQRSQAEAALRAVTGARAPLASYWLLWLEHRPS